MPEEIIRRKRRLSSFQIIILGFAGVILLGTLLLMLPISTTARNVTPFNEALFTATSAVCVTGLVVPDTGSYWSVFGQVVILGLIQIGGLGVVTVAASFALLSGRKISLMQRSTMQDAISAPKVGGIVRLTRFILRGTFLIELLGALAMLPVFCRDYGLRGVWMAMFHSISAFCNAGFDIFGGGQSMVPYTDNIYLNIITCVLIFFGGIGFLVIQELWQKKCQWKKLSMHTKVVLSVSLALIIIGTLLIKLTEPVSWLCALFHSVSTRTAGFASRPIGNFGAPALLVMIVLMFIGASSGSTGGGIKTSTFFVLIRGIFSAATNQSEKAFHYSIPKDAFKKAAVISILAAGVVITSTYILMILEPQVDLLDALFEMTSAFSTAGLSTGISSGLHLPAKILSIMIMFTGRLGPLTIASLWYFSRGELALYPDGNIVVG